MKSINVDLYISGCIGQLETLSIDNVSHVDAFVEDFYRARVFFTQSSQNFILSNIFGWL